jgi:hypothetical protein
MKIRTKKRNRRRMEGRKENDKYKKGEMEGRERMAKKAFSLKVMSHLACSSKNFMI